MSRIFCPTLERAVDDPDVGDHALVIIELGIEDQGPQRCLGIAGGGRNAFDDRPEDVGHSQPGLGADGQHLGGIDPQADHDLFLDLLGPGRLHVDLVQDRDDRQVVVHGQIGIGDGLRLHSLGRVDQQDRSLAGRQTARNLVVEVDVPRRVDQVQLINLAVQRVIDGDGPGLDRDSALPLQVHIVEQLLAKLALGDGSRLQQELIGQRALAVIDVSDDREIADEFWVNNHVNGSSGL